MREIHNLDNHPDLEKLLQKAEERINGNSPDEAAVHMRKALEYVVQQFARENPYCNGKDLFETLNHLEEERMIDKAEAALFHRIRKIGNTTGAHYTSEKISTQEMGELFQNFLNYLPRFLEKCPFPSTKALMEKNRLSVDVDNIPPLKLGITKELYDEIRDCYASDRVWNDYHQSWNKFQNDLQKDSNMTENEFYEKHFYPFKPIPEEFFFQKKNGEWYINRSEYARFYEKKVRKILSAKLQLDSFEGDIVIPGMLQEFFGFSRVYQDGITPVFEAINGDHIISEMSLFAEEIYLPDSVTSVKYPNLYWAVDGDTEKVKELHWVRGNVKKIFLSNNLSPDSDFTWTTIVEPENVRLNEGKKGTIAVVNGSVYSADLKTLIYARCGRDEVFEIPEGTETIGSCAIRDNVSNIVFPRSLRKIEKNGLVYYRKSTIVLPDYITDISGEAFAEDVKAYHEGNPDINLNKKYEAYLNKVAEQREQQKREEQENLRRQEEQKRRAAAEQQRKLQQKALEQKKQEEIDKKNKKLRLKRLFRNVLLAVAAILIVIVFVVKKNSDRKEELAAEEAKKNYAVVFIVDRDTGALSETAEKTELNSAENYVTEDKEFMFSFDDGKYTGNKGITISKYLGSKAEVVVPKEIQGYKVIQVFGDIFSGNSTIEKITVEAEIIGGGFGDCSNLREVIFPATVKKVGYRAFNNTPLLESITVDKSCVVDREFAGYEIFPTVNYIGMSEGVGEDTDVVMEDNQTYATSDGKFQLLFKDNAIQITKYFGSDTEITIPKEIKGYPVVGMYDTVLADNNTVEKVIIEAELSQCSFRDCESLKEVVFPATVKRLGYNTFYNTPQIKKITVAGDCSVDSTAAGYEISLEINYMD